MRHLRTSTFIFLLSSCACCFAQVTSRPIEPDPEPNRPLPRGSVAGRVILADTHAPARGIPVVLYALGEFGNADEESTPYAGDVGRAVTALDGSFLFQHVAPGPYIVFALQSGYLVALDGIAFPKNDSEAERKAMDKLIAENTAVIRVHGQELERADLELQRGAVLSGKVVYSDGSPAPQLPLLLQKAAKPQQEPKPGMPDDWGSMIRMEFPQLVPTTDDQGRFRIAGIATGRYRLAVTQNFDVSRNFDDTLMIVGETRLSGKLTIYSGNTMHPKDAKQYDLRPGDTVSDIEIVLPIDGLRSIHGTAAAKDGTPLNFGSLDLTDTADSSITFHTNIHSGEFRFNGIPPGTYELKATNARIFDIPLSEEISGESPDQMQEMLQRSDRSRQLKPPRAFSDTTVPVLVQAADIDNVTLILPDTKLPDPPKQPRFAIPPEVVPPQ